MKLPEHLKETNVIFTFVPDPLHINLLGAGNDACDCLEKHFPVEMSEFYEKNHLKKSGQGPGGKFNGPSIKFIIQEDSISQLEELLPIEASAFFSYMRSIRELHYLCTQNELGDYQLILHDFRTTIFMMNSDFQ